MAVGVGADKVLHAIDGVGLKVVQAGIRYPNRYDLALLSIDEGASVAATFTQNRFCAAPVHIARQHLAQCSPRYLLINTGNANAGTGQQGLLDASTSCAKVGEAFSVRAEQVLPFSTGVIGEYLPMKPLVAGVEALISAEEVDWETFARAIMTTDTRIKAASRTLTLSTSETIKITGVSKGAGMIRPNMATMLAYVATDLAIDSEQFRQIHRDAVEHSFNRITVDSDTSTNDACVGIASGKAGNSTALSANDLKLFAETYQELMLSLAQQIIRDGEGATKFVEIAVSSAADKQLALSVAYTVAHSPLVKTALTASDANWGRILAAVGRAPGIEPYELDQVDIYLDDIQIVASGGRCDSYTEAKGAAVLAKEEFAIKISLGLGDAEEVIWTTDLSHEYVSINADYRS